MRIPSFSIALLFLAGFTPLLHAQKDAKSAAAAPGVELVLELSDGSRVIGTPSIDRLKIATQYADLEVQLSLMRTLELKGADRAAMVILQNGDRMSGQLDAKEITMKTIFGQVAVPLADVSRIQVRRAGTGKALPEGAVLHYSFAKDEGGQITDESGNGNDGTVKGATYVDDGKAGGAMSFNGDQAAVITKNSPSLQLQDFTIMAWVKRADKDKVSGGGGSGMVFSYGQGGYGLGFDERQNLAVTKVGIDGVSSKLTIHDDAFHHVAVTKKGNKIVFYLDGIAYPADDYNTNFEFSSDIATGARGDTLGNSFLGLIDEMAVFNRALSDDEVKGVYESQK